MSIATFNGSRILSLALAAIVAPAAMAGSPTRNELAASRKWADAQLGARKSTLPVSSNYGGQMENFDGGKEIRTGRELMKDGLTVTLNERPAATVIVYRLVSAATSSPERFGKQSK